MRRREQIEKSDSPVCQKCEIQLLRQKDRETLKRDRSKKRHRDSREKKWEGFLCSGRRCLDGDDRSSHCWKTPNNQLVNHHKHNINCAVLCLQSVDLS